ncbi:MAG: HAD hydrolase-like protein [Woeseiaceae bacterium]|nr:HAD hydrolase-like protein [Woeseiaceae bacterium]
MRFDTLIFDLDGTISDPFVGISQSINFALEASRYPPVEPETVRPLIGPPLTEIFEHLLGPVPEATMLGLVDKYRERYATIGYTENTLYEDIPAVIEHLASRGCTLGICTSKRADYASRIVDMFGLSQFFSFVDGGDVGVEKRRQIERLLSNGLRAQSAVMIGDRAVDIVAGKSNGLKSAGVLWGFGEREELEQAAPDYLVEAPRDLADLLLQ